MINLYESNAEDFASLGLAVLQPESCTVTEIAGGMYELNMVHPIDRGGKSDLLRCGRIIKASVPSRENPIIEYETGGSGSTTVTRQVWQVTSAVTSRLYLRNSPNGTKIGYLTSGQKVQKLGEDTSTGSTWLKVATMDGGVTGYAIQGETIEGTYTYYLTNTGRTVTITIGDDTPSGVIDQVTLSKKQLFRIVSVERSSAERRVTVNARHISYDLMALHSRTSASWDKTAKQIVASFTDTEHDYWTYSGCKIEVTCYASGGAKVSLEGKNALELLLDKGGVLEQINGRIFRDNFNIYILPAASRSLGFEIRYGKNLLSANLKTDISEVVTRVLGVGSDNGSAVWGTYQNSSHINDYGIVTKVIKYAKTTRAGVNEEAAKEFSVKHIDEPKVTLDAEFVALELAPRYAELANQYAMHIYDSLRVYDPDAGIDMTVAMNKYEFDVLQQKYTQVVLGTVE